MKSVHLLELYAMELADEEHSWFVDEDDSSYFLDGVTAPSVTYSEDWDNWSENIEFDDRRWDRLQFEPFDIVEAAHLPSSPSREPLNDLTSEFTKQIEEDEYIAAVGRQQEKVLSLLEAQCVFVI